MDLRHVRTVQAVGECLVELRQTTASSAQIGYAGDTYNAAVYLARAAADANLDLRVSYLTGLGDDGFSEQMRQAWAAETIADDSVTLPGRQPGIYAVNTDHTGEREFTYWRSSSAAAVLFSDKSWLPHLGADLVHFSGITSSADEQPRTRRLHRSAPPALRLRDQLRHQLPAQAGTTQRPHVPLSPTPPASATSSSPASTTKAPFSATARSRSRSTGTASLA